MATNVFVSNANRPQTVIQATFTNHHIQPQNLSVDWLLDNDTDDTSSSSVEYIPPAELPVSVLICDLNYSLENLIFVMFFDLDSHRPHNQ